MKKKERRVILYEKHAGPFLLFAWCNFGVQRKLMVNSRGGARAPLRWKVLVLCFQSQLLDVRSLQWNRQLRGPERTHPSRERCSQRYCTHLATSALGRGLPPLSNRDGGWGGSVGFQTGSWIQLVSAGWGHIRVKEWAPDHKVCMPHTASAGFQFPKSLHSIFNRHSPRQVPLNSHISEEKSQTVIIMIVLSIKISYFYYIIIPGTLQSSSNRKVRLDLSNTGHFHLIKKTQVPVPSQAYT